MTKLLLLTFRIWRCQGKGWSDEFNGANMFEVKQGIHGTLFRACATASACKRMCALQGERVGLRRRLIIA